jgi:cell fate (sporulation/competence/biofilm development) regulator YmcA (YheA/YmcA/DUF963 family)
MPTIHLSVPDRVYRDLKEAAEVYGIQITDLIKVFIRNNIDLAKQGKLTANSSSNMEIQELRGKVEELSRIIEEMQRTSESQARIFASVLKALEDRLTNLELDMEDVRERIERGSPIIEPELIDR